MIRNPGEVTSTTPSNERSSQKSSSSRSRKSKKQVNPRKSADSENPSTFKPKQPVKVPDGVERIADTKESISSTVNEPSVIPHDVLTSDAGLPDVSSVKREKEDVAPTSVNTEEVEPPVGADGQSSEPHNDKNDDDTKVKESNLETLHEEVTVTSSELAARGHIIPNEIVEDPAECVDDVAENAGSVIHVEPNNSTSLIFGKRPLIKFSIARKKRNLLAEPAWLDPREDNTEKRKIPKDSSGTRLGEDQLLMLAGEKTKVTLAPASIKPRIQEQMLTQYPPHKTPGDDSVLCRIL